MPRSARRQGPRSAAGEKSIRSITATARRMYRAMNRAVQAFCQLLPMIRCRSPRRSASCGQASSASAMAQEASIAAASQEPVCSLLAATVSSSAGSGFRGGLDGGPSFRKGDERVSCALQ